MNNEFIESGKAAWWVAILFIVLACVFGGCTDKTHCHKYSKTAIRVGFETPREHRYMFDHSAGYIAYEIKNIEGVIDVFVVNNNYTFYVQYCPMCDVKHIAKTVEDRVIQILNRNCN